MGWLLPSRQRYVLQIKKELILCSSPRKEAASIHSAMDFNQFSWRTLLAIAYRRRKMNKEQIIRAWKDEEFRLSMSEAELSALPENPAGLIELSDLETGLVAGATASVAPVTIVEILVMASLPQTLCCAYTYRPAC
jgi:mersacidin/lichenicidin family type 2 lantibiotic